MSLLTKFKLNTISGLYENALNLLTNQRSGNGAVWPKDNQAGEGPLMNLLTKFYLNPIDNYVC